MIRAAAAGLIALLLGSVPASAAHWTVDHTKSRLGFAVTWDGEPFTARFAKWVADIDFDPNNLPDSRVKVTIDLASVTSDIPEHDDDMKNQMGFDPAKFPVAKFEAAKFRKTARGYEADGTVDLRGVKRPVTLPFSLTITGSRAHMTGIAVLSRKAFAVGTTGGAENVPVSDNAKVTVDLTATAQPR